MVGAKRPGMSDRATTGTESQGPVQVKRSYKFLLRPTSRQAAALLACLEDHRQLYNAALEERREAWRMRRKPVGYYAQALQLPGIRAADPGGQGRWSAGSQQQTLRRLDKAFAAFYSRAQAGKKPGYPRFKGRGRLRMAEWPALKNGARWDSGPDLSVRRVYLQGVGHVRVHQHRPVAGRLKTVTVRWEGKRWYVILSCDGVPARPLPSTGLAVGIDLGVARFLTTSGGAHVPNPRHLATSAHHLAAAQRALARKQPGSARRCKAAARVAALQGKARRARLDHAHKTALGLVREHDLIAHEALQPANMTRRPAPRRAPDGTWEPNGRRKKAGLNRSIRETGWGLFLRVLAAKAESAGRRVVTVDPRNTSRACSRCGHTAAGNRRTQADFRCLACGYRTHADVNAAVNILRAGLARQATHAA
jgi:putative transposase